MSNPDRPFDVDYVASLIEAHENTDSRSKQRYLERDIIDATVGSSQSSARLEQDDDDTDEVYDSTSHEARRAALRKMG